MSQGCWDSDIELTRACAEAIGLQQHTRDGIPQVASDHGIYVCTDHGRDYDIYDPIADSSQAMALVTRFKLSVRYNPFTDTWFVKKFGVMGRKEIDVWHPDLNRAIVRCVSQMRTLKKLAEAETKINHG
jgi:hypothetical protein